MSPPFDAHAKGVYIIAATPFHADGELDLDSTDTLTDFYLDRGADGLTILGMMGEAPKLTEEESVIFMKRVIKRVAGRVPVVVGASHASNRHVEALSKEAMAAGAAGIMLAPAAGLKTDDQIHQYFAGLLPRLGADVPVCYQDFPQSTGVTTSVAVLNRLFDDFEQIVVLKHEDCPGLNKITQLRKSAIADKRRRVGILVGNNGMFIPQELARGADGMMTGFSYPEMLVRVYRLFAAGKADQAEDVFDLYLPLLKHEFQPGISLALRKEVLRRRGAMACSVTRKPGPALNGEDMAELTRLMTRLESKLAVCV